MTISALHEFILVHMLFGANNVKCNKTLIRRKQIRSSVDWVSILNPLDIDNASVCKPTTFRVRRY